jgi:hypothetical protein
VILVPEAVDFVLLKPAETLLLLIPWSPLTLLWPLQVGGKFLIINNEKIVSVLFASVFF